MHVCDRFLLPPSTLVSPLVTLGTGRVSARVAVYARHVAGTASELSRALELVAEGVRAQECILFLGAGVHAPPSAGSSFASPPERRPPIGSALSLELALECGFAER